MDTPIEMELSQTARLFSDGNGGGGGAEAHPKGSQRWGRHRQLHPGDKARKSLQFSGRFWED